MVSDNNFKSSYVSGRLTHEWKANLWSLVFGRSIVVSVSSGQVEPTETLGRTRSFLSRCSHRIATARLTKERQWCDMNFFVYIHLVYQFNNLFDTPSLQSIILHCIAFQYSKVY